jgi:hypothetical protein
MIWVAFIYLVLIGIGVIGAASLWEINFNRRRECDARGEFVAAVVVSFLMGVAVGGGLAPWFWWWP